MNIWKSIEITGAFVKFWNIASWNIAFVIEKHGEY